MCKHPSNIANSTRQRLPKTKELMRYGRSESAPRLRIERTQPTYLGVATGRITQDKSDSTRSDDMLG